MNCLFVNDTKVFCFENGFYHQTLNKDFWHERYLKVFKEVYIICRKVELPQKLVGLIGRANDENINFLPINEYKIPSDYFMHHEKIKKKILPLIREVDCVIVRLPSFLGYIAIDICYNLNKPILIELVACPWDILRNHSKIGKLLAYYSRYAAKKRIKNAPFVLYVTQDFLQKNYPTRGCSVSCSDVVINSFSEETLKKRINRINKNKKIIVLGTIGAIDLKYKGQINVIKALSILKKQGHDEYIYELVGNGNKEKLQKAIRKYGVEGQVIFKGTIIHNEIYSWLDNIDIYLQPSYTEGLPRALVEAMSRALPCIGSNVGGIPELLRESELVDVSKNCAYQIATILNELNIEKKIYLANLNYEKSKQYAYNVLDKKRMEFYKQFAEHVF